MLYRLNKGITDMRKITVALAAFVLASTTTPGLSQHHHSGVIVTAQQSQTPAPRPAATPTPVNPGNASMRPDMHAPRSFTLRSGIADGRMVYIGVGGERVLTNRTAVARGIQARLGFALGMFLAGKNERQGAAR